MPRKPRNYHLPDFYHIMVQGDEKKFIFTKDIYKEKYIYLLKRNSFRNDVKLLIAYCIMDNYIHMTTKGCTCWHNEYLYCKLHMLITKN